MYDGKTVRRMWLGFCSAYIVNSEVIFSKVRTLFNLFISLTYFFHLTFLVVKSFHMKDDLKGPKLAFEKIGK